MLGLNPAASVRPPFGSSSVFVNLSDTVSVPLPTGTQVNDALVISIGHSYQVNGLTWTGSNVGILNLTGAQYNGLTYYGTVDASDLSRGSIGFHFQNAGYGIVTLVALPGPRTYLTSGGSRSSSGSSSRTVSTLASVSAGVELLLFGSAVSATDATSSSLTTDVAHNPNANASGICRYGIAPTTGVQSGTVDYSGLPNGDYQVIVAIQP